MPRAIAVKENGRWLVKVDVDEYGGEEISIRQAEVFVGDIRRAIQDARNNNTRDRMEVRV